MRRSSSMGAMVGAVCPAAHPLSCEAQALKAPAPSANTCMAPSWRAGDWPRQAACSTARGSARARAFRGTDQTDSVTEQLRRGCNAMQCGHPLCMGPGFSPCMHACHDGGRPQRARSRGTRSRGTAVSVCWRAPSKSGGPRCRIPSSPGRAGMVTCGACSLSVDGMWLGPCGCRMCRHACAGPGGRVPSMTASCMRHCQGREDVRSWRRCRPLAHTH